MGYEVKMYVVKKYDQSSSIVLVNDKVLPAWNYDEEDKSKYYYYADGTKESKTYVITEPMIDAVYGEEETSIW